MMKNIPRVAAWLLLILLLAAGCGGKDKGAVPTEVAPPSPVSPSTDNPSAGGAASAVPVAGTEAAAGSEGSTAAGQAQTNGTDKAAGDPAPAAAGDETAPARPALVELGPLARGEVATLGTLTIKLGEMETRSAGPLAPGFDFLAIEVTVTNNGKTDVRVNSLDHVLLVEPGGGSHRINLQASSGYDGNIDGPLASGQSHEGWIGFLVQLQDGKYQLIFSFPDIGKATFQFEAPPV